MVVGVYVLFNIISPIIKNKEDISIEKYNIEKYQTKSQYEVNQQSMDERLEKIYLDELESTVISKFEENNIEVILLNSGLPREDAHAFYESQGYFKKSYGFIKRI